MKQDDIYQFATNQALEMIMIFNSAGIITYANESAKQQLEYGEELCGRSIEEIFPAEMQDGNIHFGTFSEFDQEVHELTAYRKNKTCFLASVRILCWEERAGDYICLVYDVSTVLSLSQQISLTSCPS